MQYLAVDTSREPIARLAAGGDWPDRVDASSDRDHDTTTESERREL